MKKMFILAMLFVGSASTVPVMCAEYGTLSATVSSTNSAVRYAFLTGKNTVQAIANGIALPFVGTYKSFKYYPRLSSAATGAIFVGLAALWYASPDNFISHPYIVAITNGALQISVEGINYAIAFLEKCPEYAAWLKEFSCQNFGANCPLPPPIPTPTPMPFWKIW